MTSEVDVDLASIRDEEVLRQMWQQTEDFGRKKQIRTHMYKLREARLREFYATGEMDSTDFGITKTPGTPSHGDSLADQSFQSFKTKEIRDSESPTRELKYTRGGVIVPDTSGWNVVTSSEVSPDGKSYKTESLATTEGVQQISGGHSQFSGKNEHMQKASHKGDDKNYVKTAAESSNTQLQEKSVVGDENSGRVEQKSSSIVSSSHVTTSKHSSSGPEAILDHQKVLNDFDQLVDSAVSTEKSSTTQKKHQHQQQQQTSSETKSSTVRQERQVKEQHHEERYQEQQQQQQHYKQTQNERYVTADSTNQDRLRTNQIRTNETNQSEQIRRKLIQEEVDLLAATPGKIISRSVEYPEPNTKVITETKTLPDGTTITTRKFETKSASSKSWSTSSNQKECTSSQSVVEDRSQRNRIGYSVDGKERVISDDYNVSRVTSKPSPQILRDTDRKPGKNDRPEDQHTFTQQTTKQQQVHDHVDRNVQRAVTKEDRIHQEQTKSFHKEDTRRQDSEVSQKDLRNVRDIKHQTIDTADRAEKLRDQVETIALDSAHRTVKKDLSQKIQDAKITNQDFIETERGCVMTDHSPRKTPEKYTMEPKIGSTISKGEIHRTHHDQQESSQISHQSLQEHSTTTQHHKSSQDFTTQGFPSVRPQRVDEQKRPSQDFTTQGFPSVRPQRVDEQRRPSQDFTTHGFPSVKGDKPTKKFTEDYSTHGFPSVRPQDHGYPSQGLTSPQTRKPDDSLGPKKITDQCYDVVSKQSHETTRNMSENVEQRTIKEQQTVRSSEKRTVAKESEDFTTHGFPSTRSEVDTPFRSAPRPDRFQPNEKTQDLRHVTETRQTTEQRRIQREKEDLTTHRIPLDKPDKAPHGRPVEKPRETDLHPVDSPKRSGPVTSPQQTTYYPTEESSEIRSVSETKRINQQKEINRTQQDFTTEGFPSVKPDQRDGKQQPPYQGYPSTIPQQKEHRPQYPDESSPRTYQTPQETRPFERTDSSRPVYTSVAPQIPGEKPVPHTTITEQPKTDFSTQGYPSTRPQQLDEVYPSTTRPEQTYPHGIPSQTYVDRDDTSSVTTEKTDISETTRRNRNEYNSSRISVEVDAAHDAFARSLRCISPVDQSRGSVKSLRTSTNSVRSSTSPDKRSRRSPSRDSDSSRLSSSTITKTRDKKDVTRKTTPIITKKSPTSERPSTRDEGRPKNQPGVYRSTETVDLAKSRFEKDEVKTRGIKQISQRPQDTKGEIYKHDRFIEEEENSYEKVLGSFPREPEIVQQKKIYSQIEQPQKEPVEEPLFQKKNITPLCPDVPLRKPITPVTSPQSQYSPRKPSEKISPTSRTPLQAGPVAKPIPKQPKASETLHTKITETRHTTKPTPREQDISKKTKTRETIAIEFIDGPTKPKIIGTPLLKPQPHIIPNRVAPKRTTTVTTTEDITDTGKTQYKHDFHTTRSDTTKPYTILGPIPKEYPEGFVPLKDVPYGGPQSSIPRVPKVSRSPHSPNEGSTRPGPDRRTHSPRPSVDSVTEVPKSLKKPNSKSPSSRQTEPLLPKKKDTKSPATPQIERRPTSDTKFTKTMKIENAIVRDTERKQPKKTIGKPQSSEDEGFEPESPRSGSPPYSTNNVDYQRNLDATDITVQVNLKNVGQNVDLVTTITDTDSTGKRFVNKEFIEREKEEIEINNRPRTSSKSPVRQIPIQETHYPDETGEPFYLVPSEDKEDNKPQKPANFRKPKPPLNRSETYEERCRQILGMDHETVVSETKKTDISEAEDFITTERTLQERDHTRRQPSPVASPRSASPRKPSQISGDTLITTSETVTTTSKSKTPVRDQSPTKEPGDETYQRTYSPTVSPYSSLPRKKTPKDTPTESPYSRSPASSPTRKLPESKPYYEEPVEKSPSRKVPSKQYTSRSVDVQQEEKDIQHRTEKTTLSTKKETYEIDDSTESHKIHETTFQVPDKSAMRKSPSPAYSPDRRTVPRSLLTDTSPTSKKPYTTEVCYEVTKREVIKEKIPMESPRTKSPATSPTRRTQISPKSSDSSPIRSNHPSIDVEYITTRENIIKDKSLRKTEKERKTTTVKGVLGPSGVSPQTRSPASSPVRKTPVTGRPTEKSPSRYTSSTTETEYESSVVKKTKGATDTIGVDRKTSNINLKVLKPEIASHSPERSPTRRSPQGPTIGTTITKRTPADTSRFPVSAPSTLKRPTVRSGESSPSRYSPSSIDVEYGSTTTRKEVIDRKTDTSHKTSTSSLRTTKTVETITGTPEHPNHITTAKIHLSPTPTRKISSPDKKSVREPEMKTVKTIRQTTRESIIKEPKTTVQKSPLRPSTERIQPGRRIDTKKIHETSTQQQRKRIEKKTTRVEDESDSSIVREREQVKIVRETKGGPISTTNKKSPSKKFPVNERKESAPVYSSTTRSTKDTTEKMTRSTSDNLIRTSVNKRTKPEIETTLVGPGTTKSPRKSSTGERRPSKHLSTKTINLSTTNNIINSEDMENVIIDIQQAKSSREPSPNKIIPTPVSVDLDTGKARYPDTVQEPDEEPRRKPKVKNIPIFEEEHNNYVGCHITELDETYEEKLKRKKSTTTTVESDDETIVKTSTRTTKTSRESSPYKDARRLTENDNVEDECHLSVHDKVMKFINSAEDVKKPKTSSPFRRETAREEFSEKDDCLLSVNAKVNKFLSTAESITKPMKSASPKPIQRPNIEDLDEELKTDECVLSVSQKVNKFINTAEKLVAPSPQRSPELVAKIERQISRQSDDNEKDVVTKTTTKSSVTERYTPGKTRPDGKPASPKPALKSSEAIRKAKQVFENGTKITNTSTTRQKDILSRPSVWEGKKTATDVRLQDIGVYKKHGKEVIEDVVTSTKRHHSKSPACDVEDYPSKPLKSNINLSESVLSKKDLYEIHSTSSKTDEYNTHTTKIKSGHQEVKTRPKSPSSKSPARVRPDSDEYGTKTTTTRSTYSSSRDQNFSDEHPSSGNRTPSRRSHPSDEYSPSRSTNVQVEKNTKRTTSTSKYPDDTPTSQHSPSSSSPTPKHYYGTEPPRSPLTRSKDYLSQSKDHSHSERRQSHTHTTNDSVTAKRSLFEKSEQDSRLETPSPGPRPSYMDHTMSSLEHIRRDSMEVNKSFLRKSSIDSNSIHEHDGSTRSGVKFGVELKHIGAVPEKQRRKSSSSEIPHIEEIFDLELLEQMLHVVVGYEQRRRIRTQIRLVKNMIDTQNREACHTEYTKMVQQERERSHSRGSTPSPDRYISPSRKESFKTSSSRFIETESKHISRHVEKVTKERSSSPQSKIERFETVKEVHRTGATGKKPVVVTKDIKDEKPIWASKNILRKTADTEKNIRNTSSSTVKKTSTSTTNKSQGQRQKITSTEDCVTSSYGIGPTDEDGKPLFGIRALKKKSQPSETTKVTGTVITEKYYSQNGEEPVGERKVTVYSTSPDDIEKYESKFGDRKSSDTIKRERSSKDGITTVTRVEKISKGGDAEAQEIPAILDSKNSTTTTTTTATITTRPSKLVRKGSVKEISDKFIRKDSMASSIPEKSSCSSYPKAGLILRAQTQTTNRYSSADDSYIPSDTVEYDDESGDEDRNPRKYTITESDSEVESIKIRHTADESNSTTKSFLNSSGTKVTGLNDVLDRMRNADNVIEDGDTAEDKEARSLLNKFLGATVLMSGMESMVPRNVTSVIGGPPDLGRYEVKTTHLTNTTKKEDISTPVDEITCVIEDIWDENILKGLLEKSTTYEDRRRIRARIRQLMAEREELRTTQTTETKEENDGAVVTTTTKVTTRTVAAPPPKTMSPFAKFRQLDKQTSPQNPNSPVTSSSPGGTNRGAAIFRFTDPSLNARAATAKDQLLYWCQMKTKEYENVQISNFSGSWTDGLAFCALIHHFLPEAFDYSKLTPQQRRYNFELAFRVADEEAGIAPLLDVEDMVVMKRPDWKCVFTYVQSIYRRFRNCQ